MTLPLGIAAAQFLNRRSRTCSLRCATASSAIRKWVRSRSVKRVGCDRVARCNAPSDIVELLCEDDIDEDALRVLEHFELAPGAGQCRLDAVKPRRRGSLDHVMADGKRARRADDAEQARLLQIDAAMLGHETSEPAERRLHDTRGLSQQLGEIRPARSPHRRPRARAHRHAASPCTQRRSKKMSTLSRSCGLERPIQWSMRCARSRPSRASRGSSP